MCEKHCPVLIKINNFKEGGMLVPFGLVYFFIFYQEGGSSLLKSYNLYNKLSSLPVCLPLF